MFSLNKKNSGMKEQDDLAHRKVYVAQKGLVKYLQWLQKMDYDFLILMELIVVPLCHLRLYTQLTFILRESMPAAQILKKMSMRIMSLRRSIGYIIQDNWLYGVEHNHDSQLNMVYPYFPRLPHVQITKIVRCPFSTHFVSCHWM
ncbi:hypothetical protein C5167_045159 [Papaver somniferum]|uniref:Uncharacterized protein n=1 Tax=Papaver somniferum TaxID=3469 RepID=A0A4Y7LCG2_PAPSO|nr:hypothetical protein C5167_045159 [Papaver somniferum]